VSDSIERAPLAAAPQTAPRGKLSTAGEALVAAHGAEQRPDEPSLQHAAAMAVVGGHGAAALQPARARQAVVVNRGVTAASHALGALARSVRTTLDMDDGSGGSEMLVDDERGPAPGGAGASGSLLAAAGGASLHAYALRGARAANDRDARSVAAARAGAQSAAEGQPCGKGPVVPEELAAMAPVVRVRAPARVQHTQPRRYARSLRVACWGVALACTLALASAYWMLASPPQHEHEHDGQAACEHSQGCESR